MPELTNFLELSYEELEARNLSMKAERAKNQPSDYYQERVFKHLKEEKRIKAVTVCFTDIEGKFLMLDYNKDFFLEAFDNLTFDGSSIRGFTAQAQSDLRLKVNWQSFKWLPADVFGPGKVLLFCNVCDRDGTLYKSDFRGQLQHLADELYKKEKIIVHASPEIEGILLEGTNAEHCFTESTGFNLATYGGYFNALPSDKLRQFIDKVAEATRAMGFENEKDHAEVAPSQFELSYKYTDILQAADCVLLYKLVCRQIAKANGYTATFLPKPMMDINGNGMHTNISLSKNGKNIFYAATDENKLSQDAYKFLTGILYHAKDICLILNSSVNSYRRLDPSFEAPNEIKVSANDRSAMIRIPLGNEKTARVEVRSVSPDCNPYLEMYALLKVGLKGMAAEQKEYQEFAAILQKRERLPANIYDAIRYFKRSEIIKEILGEENQQKYCALKEEVANRSPKELGKKVKSGEVRYHHEVTNQSIWYEF
jgi:glutamine synthetase